jgi:hypothetical protein
VYQRKIKFHNVWILSFFPANLIAHRAGGFAGGLTRSLTFAAAAGLGGLSQRDFVYGGHMLFHERSSNIIILNRTHAPSLEG